MTSKWQNVDAGPRQVKDANKAIGALDWEGKTFIEVNGVVGGEEHRTAMTGMFGAVRPEVVALGDAIGEKYGYQVTKANVRAVIADFEAALIEAVKSRPVQDNRRSQDEEAERTAKAAARDAEYEAKRAAETALLEQVRAKAPAGAKALIVAEYCEDESDSMTDYYNSRTVRTVAIGFRTGSREDFRQLRAAAAAFPETAHMASDETLKAWGEANGIRVWFELEHRDNYSMGAGNYLSDHGGAHGGTGWLVRSADLTGSYTHLTEDAIPDKPAEPERDTAPAAKGPRATTIQGDVLDILSHATTDGNALRMNQRLSREDYVRVNDVLAAAGGKWNRKAQAHLFPGPAADVLASLLSDGTVVRPQDEGYFPTPAAIVADMIALADLTPGMEVLEPSAGDGAIASAVAGAGAAVDCVEQNAKRAGGIYEAGYARSVTLADFLALPQRPVYDRVIMNPPFADKADIAHVTHALGFLRPGGLLIAVMAGGVMFREDKATAGFRAVVDEAGGMLEQLPEGAFKESGTGVNTVLAVIPVSDDRWAALRAAS